MTSSANTPAKSTATSAAPHGTHPAVTQATPPSELPEERHRVLVIDDDPLFARLICHQLQKLGYEAATVTSLAQAAQSAMAEHFDVVLLDRHLGGKVDSLEQLQTVRVRIPNTPIILITSDNSVEVAVEAVRQGAFDFIAKPVDEARLLVSMKRAVEHVKLMNFVGAARTSPSHEARFEGMVGNDPSMLTVYRSIENVAPTTASVMIQGESGTGKELVARAIHMRSRRRSGPFVALNMAALPKELVESILFGHEKGAFTGADRRRIGAAEEASGGTLFLDEICEMPIDLQSKLLRFLQERAFRRIGGTADIAADVRIISATNRDPIAEVKARNLRADLYYRLNVVPLFLPPLRQRVGDIPLLALDALHTHAQQHGKKFTSIDAKLIERLKAMPWHGNVRQLAHTIERLVVLNDGLTLNMAMMPPDLLAQIEEEGAALWGAQQVSALPRAGLQHANPPSQPDIATTTHTSPDIAAQAPVAQPPDASITAPLANTVAMAFEEASPTASEAWQAGRFSGGSSTEADAATSASPAGASPAPGHLCVPRDETDVVPMATLEREAIEAAIRICQGSAGKAARLLCVSEATIYRKLKSYGLSCSQLTPPT